MYVGKNFFSGWERKEKQQLTCVNEVARCCKNVMVLQSTYTNTETNLNVEIYVTRITSNTLIFRLEMRDHYHD